MKVLTVRTFVLTGLILVSNLALASDDPEKKAREVVKASIEAMGGDAYLNVESLASKGRYFWFRKGRKAFSYYQDWSVLDPVKSRFQLGKEKKPEYVSVRNLELGKGWDQEGVEVDEVPEEELDDFRLSVKQDFDYILRKRLNEEGMTLYYYGPDEIDGGGEYEAVEFLDATNISVIVFFDREEHLPAKLETSYTDKMGIKHTREQEFANWHEIQGIYMPLRFDTFVDDELSSQRFVEEITLNSTIPAEFFLKPTVTKK
jgi:hypothetical protein